MKKNYLQFGKRIRFYRIKNSQSITEVAKEIGIDRTHLSRIENGHERPSEDLFWKLMRHYDLTNNNLEVMDIASLMDYKPKIVVEDRKEANLPNMKDTKNPDTGLQKINELKVTVPQDKPVLYTDSVFITRTQYGVVFDFAQAMGSSNEHLVVSRIGMSEQHAKALLNVLEAKLKEDNKTQIDRKLN